MLAVCPGGVNGLCNGWLIFVNTAVARRTREGRSDLARQVPVVTRDVLELFFDGCDAAVTSAAAAAGRTLVPTASWARGPCVVGVNHLRTVRRTRGSSAVRWHAPRDISRLRGGRRVRPAGRTAPCVGQGSSGFVGPPCEVERWVPFKVLARPTRLSPAPMPRTCVPTESASTLGRRPDARVGIGHFARIWRTPPPSRPSGGIRLNRGLPESSSHTFLGERLGRGLHRPPRREAHQRAGPRRSVDRTPGVAAVEGLRPRPLLRRRGNGRRGTPGTSGPIPGARTNSSYRSPGRPGWSRGRRPARSGPAAWCCATSTAR